MCVAMHRRRMSTRPLVFEIYKYKFVVNRRLAYFNIHQLRSVIHEQLFFTRTQRFNLIDARTGHLQTQSALVFVWSTTRQKVAFPVLSSTLSWNRQHSSKSECVSIAKAGVVRFSALHSLTRHYNLSWHEICTISQHNLPAAESSEMIISGNLNRVI